MSRSTMKLPVQTEIDRHRIRYQQEVTSKPMQARQDELPEVATVPNRMEIKKLPKGTQNIIRGKLDSAL